MREAFCVLYKDLRQDPPAKRLSGCFASLELAIEAACDVALTQAEPLEIRGSEGTLIEKAELQKALLTARPRPLNSKKTGGTPLPRYARRWVDR